MLSCCWSQCTKEHLNIWTYSVNQRHTCHLHPIFIRNSKPTINKENITAKPKKNASGQSGALVLDIEILWWFVRRNKLQSKRNFWPPWTVFQRWKRRWKFGRGLLFPEKGVKQRIWVVFFNLFCNFHPEIWGRFQILTNTFHIRLQPPTRNVKIPQPTCAGPLL